MSGVVPHSRLEADVLIREMVPSDAQQAAELSGELGYPASADEIRQRLHELQQASHAVYAACLDGVVVGWIEVGIAHHLQSGACGEIGGLIVSATCQGRGIGRRLVETAEQWVASRGITKLVVRSRITRAAAHDFYLGLNFERLKTSAVFKKTIELP